MDALEANGSPKPEFETDEDRSYFITRLFVHEGFAKEVDGDKEKVTPKMKEVFVNATKNETSFETSLKQVLKQKDYKKLEHVIIKLAHDEVISIQEVMALTKKSRTTAWRYMQILVESGVVEATGNTNNVSYKRCYPHK